MTFEHDFREWLDASFHTDIPANVKAFSFNLFEPAPVQGVKFGIELVGAGQFDKDDQDWPCSEVWEPAQRQLNIPSAYSSEEWEMCLERMKILALQVLAEPSRVAAILKSRAGIGLGFVDGDLELLWRR